MVRQIGQAKAGLAADYAAQLARNVGKVVFFAKHIDVMDAAEETFAKRGIRYASIRGDQTPKARQADIDAFINDPDVAVVVCSLTAAGVGVNLQVASNVVLAELSWTAAEQTQAIDRVHRIGQDEPVTAWRIIAAQTIDTQDRRADRQQGRASPPARSTAPTRRSARRPTCSSRRWSRCSPRRSRPSARAPRREPPYTEGARLPWTPVAIHPPPRESTWDPSSQHPCGRETVSCATLRARHLDGRPLGARAVR